MSSEATGPRPTNGRPATVPHAQVAPEGSLEILSQTEVSRLRQVSNEALHELFRRCSLAVLNSGGQLDDAKQILERYRTFEIELVQQDRGIRLELRNAPAEAFVDGKMIRGLREHLFAVLRDVLYNRVEVEGSGRFDLEDSTGITNAVFELLRHARCLKTETPNIVVCWGGHSITRNEYDYTKEVGYQLGLRGMNICTGCGPGAMKGPMKGATIAHAKQRIRDGRYLGITEPGIIAAEAPNAIVNELTIMPDIEKRLEAFVRVGHGIVVFPGGAGTAEEILYLLGILLNPDNAGIPFPLIFTGPASSRDYFRQIDDFIATTLGKAATVHYEIIIDDPPAVARRLRAGLERVQSFRRRRSDAFFFNWLLNVDLDFQLPFAVTHANMASLNLRRDQPAHSLASSLRRAFSGIVAGNVKDDGIRLVEAGGPFELTGDPSVLRLLDALLSAFVAHKRMKLPVMEYVPCYRIVGLPRAATQVKP